jgi:hypothetical protein
VIQEGQAEQRQSGTTPIKAQELHYSLSRQEQASVKPLTTFFINTCFSQLLFQSFSIFTSNPSTLCFLLREHLSIHPITQPAIMDFVNKMTGGGEKPTEQQQQGSTSGEQKEGGGFLGGLGNKFNEAAGGGKASEKNEDYLDKGALPGEPTFLLAIALTVNRRRLRSGEVSRRRPSG